MVAMRLCAMAVIRDYNDGRLMWPIAVDARRGGRHDISDVESLPASDEEYFPPATDIDSARITPRVSRTAVAVFELDTWSPWSLSRRFRHLLHMQFVVFDRRSGISRRTSSWH
jgi:hypothetical protein